MSRSPSITGLIGPATLAVTPGQVSASAPQSGNSPPVTITVHPTDDGRSATVRSVMVDLTVEAGYFAATTNPWMIASMPDDSATAWSARLVIVS